MEIFPNVLKLKHLCTNFVLVFSSYNDNLASILMVEIWNPTNLTYLRTIWMVRGIFAGDVELWSTPWGIFLVFTWGSVKVCKPSSNDVCVCLSSIFLKEWLFELTNLFVTNFLKHLLQTLLWKPKIFLDVVWNSEILWSPSHVNYG